MDSSQVTGESLGQRNSPCMVPQAAAFIITFVSSLVSILPACFFIFAGVFLLMAFDSYGIRGGVVTTRRDWFQTWSLLGALWCIFPLPLIAVSGGLTVGITYLKGRIPEAQKQV